MTKEQKQLIATKYIYWLKYEHRNLFSAQALIYYD